MSQVLTMALTESANICYISDRVASTVKLNIRETFRGHNDFPANGYIMNGQHSENKRSIT